MIPPGLFITATDTGVGKTWVTSALISHLKGQGDRVGALKPISTSGIVQADGTLISPDALELARALGGEFPPSRITPLTFEGDVAPSVAIEMQGLNIGRDDLISYSRSALGWWAERVDLVLVEGVGGLLCPISKGVLAVDLAKELDYPLIVVARRGLGTINHTLLTVEAALRRGVRVAGIILNASEATPPSLAEATNPEQISRLIPDIPILAEIPFSISGPDLSRMLSVVDWRALCLQPRIVRSTDRSQ